MSDLLPLSRDNLIRQARYSIQEGDAVLARLDPGVVDPASSSAARAHYAAASVRIQLAGYLGMTEEHEAQQERWADLSRPSMVVTQPAELDPAIRQAYAQSPTPQVVADLGRELVDRVERQRQDDYIAGAQLAADTGGTSQRRGVHGDPWRSR